MTPTSTLKPAVLLALIVVASILLVACGSDKDAQSDASDTPSGDMSADGDVTTDGDATTDATPDTVLDVPTDFTDPEAPWAHCPDPVVNQISDGVFSLVVESGADYCRRYPEQAPLKEELDGKIKLHLAPSAHALPMASGSHPFTLSACALHIDGTALSTNGPGTLSVMRDEQSGFDFIDYRLAQPLTDANGGSWVLEVQLGFEAYLTEMETLQDSYRLGPYDSSVWETDAFALLGLSICPGDTCDGVEFQDRFNFNSCTFANIPNPRVARVDFDGGHFETQTRIGGSFASTEPAILLGASGEIDGTSFTEDDYYQLVYSPWHHHFDMDQAVLFDDPIGGYCGIQAILIPAYPETGFERTELSLIDCDFNVLETRTVTNVTLDMGF